MHCWLINFYLIYNYIFLPFDTYLLFIVIYLLCICIYF